MQVMPSKYQDSYHQVYQNSWQNAQPTISPVQGNPAPLQVVAPRAPIGGDECLSPIKVIPIVELSANLERVANS